MMTPAALSGSVTTTQLGSVESRPLSNLSMRRPGSQQSQQQNIQLHLQQQHQMQQDLQKMEMKQKIADKPIYDSVSIELLEKLTSMKQPYFGRI